MKKLAALLLALALCLAALPASAEDVSPLGVWYLSHMVINDVDCPVLDNSAIILTVNEGGTLVLEAPDVLPDPVSGTWSVSGSVITLVVEGDPLDCEIVDGEFAISSDGVAVYLSRTPERPAVLIPAVQAESAADFEGSWSYVAQVQNYVFIPRNDTIPAVYDRMEIGDGKITLESTLDDENAVPAVYDYTFGDGVLKARDDGDPSVDMVFSLREDGALFMETTTDYHGREIVSTIVFEREEILPVSFVTIQEWMDARGECGDCLMLLKIQEVLNPVLAVVSDETGSVNLYSGKEGEPTLWLVDHARNLTGYWIVISNPRWNEYEGTVEMADWTLLRMVPGE